MKFETGTERDYQKMHFYGESSWSNLTTFAENKYNPIEINGDLELEQFKKETIKKIIYRINRYI